MCLSFSHQRQEQESKGEETRGKSKGFPPYDNVDTQTGVNTPTLEAVPPKEDKKRRKMGKEEKERRISLQA